MTPDDLPDPETAAADAADDAHTERWREERARGRAHEVECPWLTDGCASRGRLHRPLKGGTDDDICIECLESCCCGALRKHGARVRAAERERAAVDHPVERALVLLQTIGLDITYGDDGLRIIAKQIVDMGRADERERAAGRVERAANPTFSGERFFQLSDAGPVELVRLSTALAAIREGGA